jgi:hypothetical protein
MTIPFWFILIILVIIGIIGFVVIADKAGDYDFFTPLFALGFAIIFIVLAIGLALGKWVF